jgi:class 3 adenylate cyclase
MHTQSQLPAWNDSALIDSTSVDPEVDARSKLIVNELLAAAARQGELGIAYARLVLGVLVTALWPVLHWGNLLRLVPRSVAAFSLGLLALIWTLVVFRKLRDANPTPQLTYASIVIDALLINSLILFYVLAPGASHQSVVEVHSTAFVYVAILSSGVRFSPAAAWLGAVVNSLLFGGLVVASTLMVNDLRIIGGAEWLTVLIGLIASTILAVRIATRTRRLVGQAARATLRSETARARLGAYLSPEIAQEVLKEGALRLGGQRQDVAVLFSDLRGFTTYAEGLEPEEIVAQLNDYMRVMVNTISAHEGIVDKFIGDGIMAVFGAPNPRPDDADRAIQCGYAMIEAIERLNQTRAARNLPHLKHGIGIHYGPVIAGNVGTPERAAYTVIGDTVNLASRLETMTKQLHVDLIVSDAAYLASTCEQPLKRLDNMKVAGRTGTISIYVK